MTRPSPRLTPTRIRQRTPAPRWSGQRSLRIDPATGHTVPADFQAFCRETGQPIPRSHGEIARCVLESLALLYRVEMDGMEKLTGRTLTRLHVVGGGCRNALLNQATADATGRTVIAGPVEATAAGNILVQAIAMKALKDIGRLRQVVTRSFEVVTYQPAGGAAWSAARAAFDTLRKAPSFTK